MKTNHTPGPWYLGRNGNRVFAKPGWLPRRICELPGEDVATAEDEANAHLISAAPELLSELKSLVNLIAHEYPKQQATWLEGARAAIAKAGGKNE